MLTRHALLLCWLVSASLLRVIDGDTFDATLAITDRLTETARVRVLGVNTPERGQPGYDTATAYTREWLERGPFTVSWCARDVFGRVLGTVERERDSLATRLLERKLGVPR